MVSTVAVAEPVFEKAPRKADQSTTPEWIRPPAITLPTGERLDITDPEDVFQRLVDGVEAEHGAVWAQADIAAYLYALAGSGKARTAMLGELVKQAGKTKRTWYRYVGIARTFPPEFRYTDVSINTYLVAMTTTEPLDALQSAVAYGWTAEQLREHIQNGKTPPERLSILDDTYDAAGLNIPQIVELLASLLEDVPERGSGPLLSVRLRIDAEYQGEAA